MKQKKKKPWIKLYLWVRADLPSNNHSDSLRILSQNTIITPNRVIIAISADSVQDQVRTVRNAEYKLRENWFRKPLQDVIYFRINPFKVRYKSFDCLRAKKFLHLGSGIRSAIKSKIIKLTKSLIWNVLLTWTQIPNMKHFR